MSRLCPLGGFGAQVRRTIDVALADTASTAGAGAVGPDDTLPTLPQRVVHFHYRWVPPEGNCSSLPPRTSALPLAQHISVFSHRRSALHRTVRCGCAHLLMVCLTRQILSQLRGAAQHRWPAPHRQRGGAGTYGTALCTTHCCCCCACGPRTRVHRSGDLYACLVIPLT